MRYRPQIQVVQVPDLLQVAIDTLSISIVAYVESFMA